MPRLIDADALKKAFKDADCGMGFNDNEIHDLITNAPTVQQSEFDLLWNLKQIADLDPKNGNIGTAVFMAKEAMNNYKFSPTFQREGWKLVPFRDDLITEEMKRALFRNLIHADDEAYVIKAIIAAAPTDTE